MIIVKAHYVYYLLYGHATPRRICGVRVCRKFDWLIEKTFYFFDWENFLFLIEKTFYFDWENFLFLIEKTFYCAESTEYRPCTVGEVRWPG
jgi:hypothetical protein